MNYVGDRKSWNIAKAKRVGVLLLSPGLLFLLAVFVMGFTADFFSNHPCKACLPCPSSTTVPDTGTDDVQKRSMVDLTLQEERNDTSNLGLPSTLVPPSLETFSPPSTAPTVASTDPPPVEEEDEEPLPPLIIPITPTHNRAAQAFHMTQVVNFLRVVPPPILWIVVEALEKTDETAKLLNRTAGKCMRVGGAKTCSTIDYVHIASKKQAEDKAVSRGVRQRNAALDYIQENNIKGIVYFMDDDNAYAPELFEEIRKVKRVGLFPVGLLWSWEYKKLIPWRQIEPFVERPLVRVGKTGSPEIYGWETFEWALEAEPGTGRQFNIDMAGFAFNSELLWEPKSNVTKRPIHPVRFVSKFAWLETLFLSKLLPKESYAEPLADMCQDVWVWHVKFETRPTDPYPADWRVPQPGRLVQDPKPVKGISRYLRNGRRHKIKDYNSDIPFGYKRVQTLPNENVSSSKKKKKMSRK